MLSDEMQSENGMNLHVLNLSVSAEVTKILNLALLGEDITSDQAVLLLNATGSDYNATLQVADELRRRAVGDLVTFVVNRNINFTNVCIKRCGFCAFSRDFREEQEGDSGDTKILQDGSGCTS